MTGFDYQQWRKSSVATPEMLDSCLGRIAELEADNERLKVQLDSQAEFMHTWRMEMMRAFGACDSSPDVLVSIAKEQQAELERLKCCGNCLSAFRGLCGYTCQKMRGLVKDPTVAPPDSCCFTPSRWQPRKGGE
jgi:hypothetical protein